MATTTQNIRQDERTFYRIACQNKVKYAYENNQYGKGICTELGRGGMRLVMGRYLRPGRFVLVTVAGPSGSTYEFKATVVWSRPGDEPNTFEAGVRIYHDEPESMDQMSELMLGAVLSQARRPKAPEGPAPAPRACRFRSLVHPFAATLSATAGFVGAVINGWI